MIKKTASSDDPEGPRFKAIHLRELIGDGCFQNGLYKPSEYYGKGVPIIRINDFDNTGRVVTVDFSLVDISPEELCRYRLMSKDILVNRVNSVSHVGKSMLVRQILGSVVYESNMIRIRINEDSAVTPEYVAAVLQAGSTRSYFRKVAKPAVAQVSINQDDILSIPIINYPKVAQRHACEVLKDWDIAIQKTERLIIDKKKRNKGIFHKLLFGKMRIANRATVGQLKTKWFSVPDEWRVVSIGSIAKEVSRRNGSGHRQIPVLSCTKYKGLVDSLEYFDRQIYSKDTSAYKVVEHGEFAYATNHIEEGSIGYQDLYPKGLVSPMYTVFKIDRQEINDGYFYKLLKTETFRHIFEISTSSSVDRRGSLRWKEFAKLPVPLPSLTEQSEINEVINAAEKEVGLLRNHLELLKRQKRGLMQKLLSGEWPVKTDKLEVSP